MITDGVTGRLVAPGDAQGLVNALIEILADPALAAQWGAAARRDVETRLTWDAVAERMAPVLDGML